MKLTRPRLKNNSGISILEVLIAMIILSVALLVLLNMTMVALTGNDWSNHTTASTQLMQQKLEQLRAESNPTDGSDVINDYERRWVVSTVADHLRQIDISVTWTNIQHSVKADSLTAYIKTDSL